MKELIIKSIDISSPSSAQKIKMLEEIECTTNKNYTLKYIVPLTIVFCCFSLNIVSNESELVNTRNIVEKRKSYCNNFEDKIIIPKTKVTTYYSKMCN